LTLFFINLPSIIIDIYIIILIIIEIEQKFFITPCFPEGVLRDIFHAPSALPGGSARGQGVHRILIAASLRYVMIIKSRNKVKRMQ
jgi:hypothetical protein